MTDPKKNTKAVRRNISGIVLLDKSTDMSSNLALQCVKRLFNAKKAGHTGSLDPLATGMLPICFGEGTKLCQHLLEADKTYHVTAQLGVRTTTSDSEGEVVSQRDVPVITLEALELWLDQFRGDLNQVPSMFSALKYQGQPLYKLARQGITVDRPARAIKVYRNVVKSWDAETGQLQLEITCSKGTYIRTIVDDLGELVGCGAHVIQLRRLNVAGFDESQMISLDTLKANVDNLDAYLIPLSAVLTHWPCVSIEGDQINRLRQGQSIESDKAPELGLLRIIDQQGELLAIGEALGEGRVKPKRLIVNND